MNTPIADFVRGYEKKNMTRLHMPGHKGETFLGCESLDITEIKGADSLYEADGIIAESEANATKLFGTAKTVYSTEGSSQCIRAMLYLAMLNRKTSGKPKIVATRNVHKAFVYAAALLDLEVEWIWPEEDVHSICSCRFLPQKLEETLQGLEEPPIAVYVTSPDYLGGMQDICILADICHRNGTMLVVDNAHGAYLHFMESSMHPIDLGADICCDSAHKTLPVLTGGAYLHISKNASKSLTEHVRNAMALFGSTSPSYLTLASLDLCNAYLAGDYRSRLYEIIKELHRVRRELRNAGWQVEDTEPLKLTVRIPNGKTGMELAEQLRHAEIECEYADREYIVCMISPENNIGDLDRLVKAFGQNKNIYTEDGGIKNTESKQIMSIREALFSEQKEMAVAEACGYVCGAPTVSCPPAVPIVVSGEVIDENAVHLFEYYGITSVVVVDEKEK